MRTRTATPLWAALALGCLGTAGLAAATDQPVFRSEVAMTRVDARVVDRDGRTVTGLGAKDFLLRVDGKPVQVKNFANESTPLDVLLLLDVSGSMEPHIERIAAAADQALRVLAEGDRVGIMVFDTRTRVRLPFTANRETVVTELRKLLRSEGFDGGTHITNAMYDAARYVERNARPEARRAVVILTDDESQDRVDERGVEGAMRRANAVLSFLQAPYEEPQVLSRGPIGRGRRGGGTWGSGGTWPLPGGGGGWPGGGSGGGGPIMVDASHSAGTDNIARDTGGDTMPVSDASALEDTLARLRQRYALYFYMPEGAGQNSRVQVSLAEMAAIRYNGSQIQSRRVYINGGAQDEMETTTVQDPGNKGWGTRPAESSSGSGGTGTGWPTTSGSSDSGRRGRAVNESSGTPVDTTNSTSGSNPASSSQTTTTGDQQPVNSAPTPSAPANSAPANSAKKGGWPRATPDTSKPNQLTSTGSIPSGFPQSGSR